MVDDLFVGDVQSEFQLRAFYRSPTLTDSEQLGLDDPYERRLNPAVTDYMGIEWQLHWR